MRDRPKPKSRPEGPSKRDHIAEQTSFLSGDKSEATCSLSRDYLRSRPEARNTCSALLANRHQSPTAYRTRFPPSSKADSPIDLGSLGGSPTVNHAAAAARRGTDLLRETSRGGSVRSSAGWKICPDVRRGAHVRFRFWRRSCVGG